jgi:short-subunit dehydrogenase
MYVASKHAVFGMTEAMSAEYANTPLKFTAICPVVVRTELTDGVNKKARGIPELKPEAVAKAVLQMIEKPKQSIFVPRYVKLLHLSAQMSPSFMNKQTMKLMNIDHIMVDYDPKTREGYESKHFN